MFLRERFNFLIHYSPKKTKLSQLQMSFLNFYHLRFSHFIYILHPISSSPFLFNIHFPCQTKPAAAVVCTIPFSLGQNVLRIADTPFHYQFTGPPCPYYIAVGSTFIARVVCHRCWKKSEKNMEWKWINGCLSPNKWQIVVMYSPLVLCIAAHRPFSRPKPWSPTPQFLFVRSKRAAPCSGGGRHAANSMMTAWLAVLDINRHTTPYFVRTNGQPNSENIN